MKKTFIIGITATLLSFAGASYADFVFKTAACPNIAGHWSGTGKINNWLTTCVYHGDGNINPLDGSGKFSLSTTVKKESGGLFCPPKVSVTLNGTCVDGNIRIPTDYGTLNGTVNGNNGGARGTITVAGISSDVNVTLHKG